MRALVCAVFRYFLDRAKTNRWEIYASHAAFYVTVSAFPMLTFFFALFAQISPEGALQMLRALLGRLPKDLAAGIGGELTPGGNAAFVPVLSFAAPVLLWSASKGFGAIGEGLRTVYGNGERSTFFGRYARAFACTFIFAAAIAAALAVPVFGETVSAALSESRSDSFDLFFFITRVGRVFCFFLFFFVFALLYRFMAGKGIPFVGHLPGAALSSLGWLLFSAAFSLYLRYAAPAGRFLYGSVGAMLLLMLWVRACMVILLFGAEVNVLITGKTG
ncbi:MAG: YihY/virulence factor BrkB family protein [Clostridia bacterium]|nr:YihY/virulence factor BrkB family protein [Clostridia bacterium]